MPFASLSRRHLAVLARCAGVCGLALGSACATPSAPQVDARAIIADARKIATKNGVEELLEIPVGGTKQWISVRGRDRNNPLLLMIHGGPASPELPTSWAFQGGWEDFFTVVQWDQRGSGKTYTANDPALIGPTLSLERITEDAAEVVQYLRARYGQEKVFVLGHSWGSLVGLGLAQRHPEWLFAYVGMGQVISGRENERVGYALTLAQAEAAHHTTAVQELKAIAPYPEQDGSLPLAKLGVERKWSNAFGGLVHGRDGILHYLNLAELSPDYGPRDVEAIDLGSQLSLPHLLPDLGRFDYTQVTRFECPVVIFAGRHDTTTPSQVAAEWLQRVSAPGKQLVWFEHSAHMMMVEEPGRVLLHLVQDVLPLAKRE
ncbi:MULTISPECIES: alpha/beta fold hydrolase [unclassified Corallococcus]|uniref:alpha/beta fold hydrolase n=1 Tax=unclassified Corallococcus TaxID=2685029 RepID=UPI001A8C6BFC|nr:MULTISPECIES: alpha/beta fold hydrolase [unclassified Corallococcus]MBN9686973.1 alpha/beta fold hydrolase [Corallococcus sp. NCSPR001]WAS89195.1 alpha/beta fold hydrolase [Corallococcus sp. NCRR]